MRIVVCVKDVPDAAAERRFREDTTTDRETDRLLSELDEHAVEQALQLAEAAGDTQVTYLTMGPDGAAGALRKALSMGGDAAVHVCDDALHGTDAPGTSLVLARALEHLGFDLVMCGMASTDGGMSVVPAMLAERLGLPQLTFAGQVRLTGTTVRIRREGDTATEEVEAPLPAVVSVTDQTGAARYPSFKGITAARKKPVTTLTLADLGVGPDEVGLDAAWTRVVGITRRPPRQAGTVITDGDAGRQLVDFLADRKLI